MSDEPTKPTCSTCPYRDAPSRECRRRAPAVGQGTGDHWEPGSGWLVVLDTHWCGEHPQIEAIRMRHSEALRGQAFSGTYIKEFLAALGVKPPEST